jgi:hypothetical protein
MNSHNPNIQQDTFSEHTMKKVNNYVFDISDTVGSGYSSTVYRGRHCTSGLHVAIKVI